MTMNLLLVDDEPLARLRLRSLIEGLSELSARVVAEAGDVHQALECLRQHAVDAVLLDIRMPGLTANEGLRLADLLRQMPQAPAVVFVTAHTDHALKAFELAATDYLTKPVRRERLLAALQRVAMALEMARRALPDALPADGPALLISERGRTLRLPLGELFYFRAEQKQVQVRARGAVHLIDESLTELEQRLAGLGGHFVRIHRNALVALHAVRALELREMEAEDGSLDSESWAVRVAPFDEWLVVSRRHVAAVRAALQGSAQPAQPAQPANPAQPAQPAQPAE